MLRANKDKVPRKLKKKIPTGPYCYQGLSYDITTGVYRIRPCPLYINIKCKDKPEDKQSEIDKEFPEEIVGWCKLIKTEIDDQCKSCTINRGY